MHAAFELSDLLRLCSVHVLHQLHAPAASPRLALTVRKKTKEKGVMSHSRLHVLTVYVCVTISHELGRQTPLKFVTRTVCYDYLVTPSQYFFSFNFLKIFNYHVTVAVLIKSGKQYRDQFVIFITRLDRSQTEPVTEC